MERNDDTLRRTMRGKRYKIKGYIVTPFTVVVKALDEDEAEEFIIEATDLEYGERLEIEEVMEED